jgi:predicted enzyme related to lactoylglutathione lyase
MRNVMLGLLSLLLLSCPQLAAAAEGGAPREDAMDTGGMPQTPAGSGAHPLCWLEIAAGDKDASKKFYSELFGWQFDDSMPGYLMFTPAAGLSGALVDEPSLLAAGAQTAVPHIYTADIDGTLAALEAAGVTITEPKKDVGGGAHSAMFADASGTLYGLVNMAPQLPVPHLPSPLGAGPKPPAGSLCSIELYAGDFAAAKQLFGGLLGWGLLDTMPQYMMFDPGTGVGGVFQSHTAVARSMPYIYVDDVRAKLAEIVAAGGKSLGEPGSMPGMGTFGYFTDPSGTAMGLIGP